MFSKRPGTSGIHGQLYESKLLSLIYFRASIKDSIEEFQLAANIDKIGAFDDICLKVKLKGHVKPVAVFVQAKLNTIPGKNELVTVYFDSYLKIRNAFKPCSNDEFFNGEFEETECFFIIYTNAPDNFNDESVKCSLSSHLHDIISTGGEAKHSSRLTSDMELLHKTYLKYQITILAERIAKFISNADNDSVNKGNLQNILNDALVQTYHVLLAQTVFDVSKIVPPKQCKDKVYPRHRIATLRHDFFDTNDEYLTLFKDTLVKEVLKERKIKSTEVKILLSEYLAEPTVTKLSKLIGTVVTYDKGRLIYLNEKACTPENRPNLNQVSVDSPMVNEAVKFAVRSILLSRKFKVPVAFGNKDLTISEGKLERRINYLASVIKDFVVKCGSNNLVTIDDSLGKGFLKLNGGITSAIGNLFVFDEKTKLMKITDNKGTLGDLAKKLYERLDNEIPNLLEYKFCFKVKEFPKLFLECTEYEKEMARDFLNKLLIYSKQANEKAVEKILKSEIEKFQHEQQNYLQVHTDAIFAKYHDDMQKWWMQPEQALTRKSDLFEKAKESIIKHPLLSVINAMYWNNMKHIDYTFTEEAVSSLNLQDQRSSTVIITEHSELTVLKLLQHLKNKEYVVLDLKYIFNLPPKDWNLLLKELKDMNEGKVLILVCEAIQHDKNEILENIAAAVLNNKSIIVTKHVTFETLQRYFPTPAVHDENNSLLSLSEKSQKSILESVRVMFQGTEVSLNLILDVKSKKYVKRDVLDKIISEEIIAVGKLVVLRNYEEIKHFYVDRRIKIRKKKQPDAKMLESFLDISNDVLLVAAKAGMGKSTLLSHLTIKTKKRNPEIWIITINLLEYTSTFSQWKQNETTIDLLETLKFICQVILSNELGKTNQGDLFTLDKKDNVVYLKHCTADPLTEFELNLFLHFYYERKIIFLIDGFDEICPDYSDFVIQCLKTVNKGPRKHKMWITSRPYNEVKTNLEKEFSMENLSYEIENLTTDEENKYLQLFWEFHLKVEELNKAQCENVKKLVSYVKRNIGSNKLSSLYDVIIESAGLYLSYKFILKNDDCRAGRSNKIHLVAVDCDCSTGCCQKCIVLTSNNLVRRKLQTTPLILYLAADDVLHIIKKAHNNPEEWYRNVSNYTTYKKFLEKKIERQFQEKNGNEISKPKNNTLFKKEVASSILKHKKLAAYSIFNNHTNKLFVEKELEEIKETIKVVTNGEETDGLIDRVANGVPIFTHKTFAEFFAVEYICDCLKIEDLSEESLFLYLDVLFSQNYQQNLKKIFNQKIYIDKTFSSSLENKKDVISKWLDINKNKCLSETRDLHELLGLKYSSTNLCLIL